MQHITFSLLTDLTYHRDIITGAAGYARDHELPWLFSFQPDSKALLKSDEALRPDGAIVYLPTRETSPVPKNVPFPLVNVSSTSEKNQKIPSVLPDNHGIGRMAAAHLTARGYRILYSIGPATFFGKKRHEGFREYCVECEGLEVHYWDVPFPWSPESIIRTGLSPERLEEIVRETTNPPAFFLHDDDLALHFAQMAALQNLRVPFDLALMGVNNQEHVCMLNYPPRTSIQIAGEKMGYEAARLLHLQLQNKPLPNTVVNIPPSGLVERESTGYLNANEPSVRNALAFMQNHLSGNLLISDVANAIGLSRRVLEKRFQRHMGITIGRKWIEMRIEKARDMLLNTDLQLVEIAKLTGFNTSQRLATVFKQHTGLTLTQARRQIRR
ncbi:MAG: substrate-binding domain-containing protein [Opitutales bacterium]|nr:substrate-binding domain-containing protein [Opitutales bacterium]MCH8540860.1 substrate-binding domain-containing protein [Opitutales bacterium]